MEGSRPFLVEIQSLTIGAEERTLDLAVTDPFHVAGELSEILVAVSEAAIKIDISTDPCLDFREQAGGDIAVVVGGMKRF